MDAIDNLIDSSMKFYMHLGVENNLIILKDIITGKKYHCISTSKYNGQRGEIWFVRLVPNLDKKHDYRIVLNTPYIIIRQTEKDWVNFFQRQGIDSSKSGGEMKYQQLMKYHKEDKYWHNYLMDSYVNYEPKCIYLTGIPDIKGSKPHEL